MIHPAERIGDRKEGEGGGLRKRKEEKIKREKEKINEKGKVGKPKGNRRKLEYERRKEEGKPDMKQECRQENILDWVKEIWNHNMNSGNKKKNGFVHKRQDSEGDQRVPGASELRHCRLQRPLRVKTEFALTCEFHRECNKVLNVEMKQR